MDRRIYIIPKETMISQAVIDAAAAQGCPEIARGIPPALVGIIKPSDLPIVYIEPAAGVPAITIDARLNSLELLVTQQIIDIGDLKAKVTELEGKIPK